MNELKASEIIRLMSEFIRTYGDNSVLILDEYNGVFKPIYENQITHEGNNIVIKHECDCL
jgi:hypothetical protein